MSLTTLNETQILGTQDILQLKVQANSTQIQPLQVWQDNSSNPLARVTATGRLEIGNNIVSGATDALVQANYNPSGTMPTSVWHAPGVISSAGTINSPINWVYNELQVASAATLGSVHNTLYTKLTHTSAGAATAADLRAATMQVINQSGSAATPVGQATGLRAIASNAANAYLNNAIGIEAALSNDSGANIGTATAFNVAVPSNTGGTISTLYGLKIPDLTQGTVNYAIYSGSAPAHFGDVFEIPALSATPAGVPPTNFDRLYSKVTGGTPQLYLKDAAGVEYIVGGASSFGVQSANTVLAGPASGVAALPSFRPVASADLTSALTTPPSIGGTTPNTGAFTDLTVSQTSNPSQFNRNGGGATLQVTAYSSAATDAPIVRTRHARGSLASPSAVSSGDSIGYFAAAGHTGSSFSDSAFMIMYASENWTSTAYGSQILFYTTPNGTSVADYRLIIRNDGALENYVISNLTNTVKDALIISYGSTGAPAAGFGVGQKLQLKSDTTPQRDVARWRAFWSTATDASRKATAVLSVFDTAERDAITITTDGTQPLIGINTATPKTTLDVGGTLRSTNQIVPSGGAGLELLYAAGAGYLQAYDRSNPGYKPLNIAGHAISLYYDSTLGLYIGPNYTQALLPFYATITDASTNGIPISFIAQHNLSSGTPANNIGTGISFQAPYNTGGTGTQGEAARLRAYWTDVTPATLKGQIDFLVNDAGGARIPLTMSTNGSASTIGFLGAGPSVRQTSGANLTNNMTAGGTTDQVDNWTNLTTYSTDAAAIRNAVYQLARKLKQVNDALRTYGLLT